MQIIKRDYLQKLIDVIGTEDIKVITGVRRSGKSVLLALLADYIKANIPQANLITVNFSSLDYEHLREYHALNTYIEGHYKPEARNFVLIDEVQMCDGFENTINSLHASHKYDIYITGSNAFLLSSDLATLRRRCYRSFCLSRSIYRYLRNDSHDRTTRRWGRY